MTWKFFCPKVSSSNIKNPHIALFLKDGMSYIQSSVQSHRHLVLEDMPNCVIYPIWLLELHWFLNTNGSIEGSVEESLTYFTVWLGCGIAVIFYLLRLSRMALLLTWWTCFPLCLRVWHLVHLEYLESACLDDPANSLMFRGRTSQDARFSYPCIIASGWWHMHFALMSDDRPFWCQGSNWHA